MTDGNSHQSRRNTFRSIIEPVRRAITFSTHPNTRGEGGYHLTYQAPPSDCPQPKACGALVCCSSGWSQNSHERPVSLIIRPRSTSLGTTFGWADLLATHSQVTLQVCSSLDKKNDEATLWHSHATVSCATTTLAKVKVQDGTPDRLANLILALRDPGYQAAAYDLTFTFPDEATRAQTWSSGGEASRSTRPSTTRVLEATVIDLPGLSTISLSEDETWTYHLPLESDKGEQVGVGVEKRGDAV